jgi:hypothetical protein
MDDLSRFASSDEANTTDLPQCYRTQTDDYSLLFPRTRKRRTEEANALQNWTAQGRLDMQVGRAICRRMQVAESRGCARSQPASSQPL